MRLSVDFDADAPPTALATVLDMAVTAYTTGNITMPTIVQTWVIDSQGQESSFRVRWTS